MALFTTSAVLTQRRRQPQTDSGDSGYQAPPSTPAPRDAQPASSSSVSRAAQHAAHRLTHLFQHSPGDTASSSPPPPNTSHMSKQPDLQSQHDAAHEVVDDVIASSFAQTVDQTFSASKSLYSRQSRLTRLKGVIEEYKWMNLLDAVQALLGVLSTLLWMVQSYSAYADDNVIFLMQFVLSLLYIADIIIRVATSGALYLWSRWALIDVLTVLPILYTIYQLGWLPSNTTADRGFIVWVVDLTVVWQFLILARFLRVYKLLRIAELRRFTLWSNNELSRGLSKLLLTVLSIVLLGGGLVFLIENAYSYGEQMSFNQSLYFMVVTISTVGYGDITPKTVLGQTAVMCIILFAIVIIPMQTSDFISNLAEYSKYGSAYKAGRIPHVVLVAHQTMTSDDLDTLLHEFFHSNHNSIAYDVVILCNGGDEHRKKLLYHVKSTRFWSQVSYIVGSPSSVADLQKAAVQKAQVCFLITSSRFLDAEQELAADEETLLRAVSIKHYCPHVPLIMHILSPRNKAHVLWYQLSKFPNIQVVCLNEMKMKLFATSCMCPGVLGLVTNLLSSYDGKATLSSVFSASSSSPEMMQSTFVSSSTQTFSFSSLVRNPLTLQAWPLSSAKSPDYPAPPHSPPLADGSSSLFYSAAIRRWEEEYLFGFGQEIYTAEFPQCVDGYSFSEAAAIIYERLSLVLIGVYQSEESTGKVRVVLNPGYSGKISVKHGDLACVIAQNAEHARAMKTATYAHQFRGRNGESSEIRDRWQRERQKDRERAEEQREQWRQRCSERERRRQERRAATAAAFGHRIDMLHAGQRGAAARDGQTRGMRREGASFHSLASMAVSDDEAEDVGDEPEMEGGVMDTLSSFRANGQSVVPSMPVSSHIAKANIQQQAEDRRSNTAPEDATPNTAATPRTAADATDTAEAAGDKRAAQTSAEQRSQGDVQDSIAFDEQHLVNPVTGRVSSNQSGQPSVLGKVKETLGLGSAEEEKQAADSGAEDDAVDIKIDQPELLDHGNNATKQEEERKDAALFATATAQRDTTDQRPPSPPPAPQPQPQAAAEELHVATSIPRPSDSSASPLPDADAPSPSSARPPLPRPPSPSPQVDDGSAVVADPFTSHVVICGYIDTKIINLIRRFRDSDSRTIVLVFDNAVCFPLPDPVNAYILTHFEGVEILFAASTYRTRQQKDRLYLAYTSPCYGHHHEAEAVEEVAGGEQEDRGQHQEEQRLSQVANAGSVDGAPSELQGPLAKMHPPLSADEYTAHDRRVGQALHLPGGAAVSSVNDEHQKMDSPSPPHRAPRHPALAYSLAVNGGNSHEMTMEEMLSHANWFRRACIHRADSVLILANPFSSPAGSITSAQSQDSASAASQHLLSSLLSATASQTSSASDEMMKADQYGLLIYSSIQAYLQQCRSSLCPALTVHVTSATFNIVNIELIHHSNVRLLRHDADTTEEYRPTQPQESGWAWVWRAARKWWRKRRKQSSLRYQKKRWKKRLAKLQRRRKQQFAASGGSLQKQRSGIDNNQHSPTADIRQQEQEEQERGGRPTPEEEALRKEDALFASNLEQHYKAFYTADGLMFSGKILDALIVQAFYHPLVYDTVSALVGGYTHTIPKPQFRKILESGEEEQEEQERKQGAEEQTRKGGEEDGHAEGEQREQEAMGHNDRTFRVELLLVDVPAVMVGRTYGYLTLKLMLENGWVCIGLYRDRRAVIRMRNRCREKTVVTEAQRQRRARQTSQPEFAPRPSPSRPPQPQQSQQQKTREQQQQQQLISHGASAAAEPQSSTRSTPSPQPSETCEHRHRRSSNRSPRPPSRQSLQQRAVSPPLLVSPGHAVSAIEMAEQKRRAQSFNVGEFQSELSPQAAEHRQWEDERRRQQAAERGQHHHHHDHRHHHHHHHHSHAEGAEILSDGSASDTEAGSTTVSTDASDTFTVKQATTIRRQSRLSSRTAAVVTASGRVARSPSPLPGLGTGGSGSAYATLLTHHEEADDEADDADHLDTSPKVHQQMTALTPHTFQTPAEEQKEAQQTAKETETSTQADHQQPQQEKEHKPAAQNSAKADAAKSDMSVAAQSIGYAREIKRLKDANKSLTDEPEDERPDSASSSSSSFSSSGSSEEYPEDADDEWDELGAMSSPYASRTLFYVLTNPPADTILHARDRLYVLVQRWLKETTVERVMGAEAMQHVKQQMERDQEQEPERGEGMQERQQLKAGHRSMSDSNAAAGATAPGGEHQQSHRQHLARSSSDDASRCEEPLHGTEPFSIPRSYSAELQSVFREFAHHGSGEGEPQRQPSPQPSPHPSPPDRPDSASPRPGASPEQASLQALQQQLAAQQAMLQSIQKQLMALSHPQHPHPHHPHHAAASPSFHRPSNSSASAPPSPPPESHRSSSPGPQSRVHMPAEHDSFSYELYHRAHQPGRQQPHRAPARAPGSHSGAHTPASSHPVSDTLAPIAGVEFAARTTPHRHQSISQHSEPSVSSHSSHPSYSLTYSQGSAASLPTPSSTLSAFHLVSPSGAAGGSLTTAAGSRALGLPPMPPRAPSPNSKRATR